MPNRANTRPTDVGCQLPPRGHATPLRFNSLVIARQVVNPSALILPMTGASRKAYRAVFDLPANRSVPACLGPAYTKEQTAFATNLDQSCARLVRRLRPLSLSGFRSMKAGCRCFTMASVGAFPVTVLSRAEPDSLHIFGRMPLSPQYLTSRARRYRHLATKMLALAAHAQNDAVAPRLRELAEKLVSDAMRDEREAQALMEESI